MNRFSAYLIPAALIGAAATASADQNAMNTALEHWDRLMREYEAALKVAKTPNQIEAIRRPDGEEVALLLWHSGHALYFLLTEAVRTVEADAALRKVQPFE